MKKYILLLITTLLFISCVNKPAEWDLEGIAYQNNATDEELLTKGKSSLYERFNENKGINKGIIGDFVYIWEKDYDSSLIAYHFYDDGDTARCVYTNYSYIGMKSNSITKRYKFSLFTKDGDFYMRLGYSDYKYLVSDHYLYIFH